MHSTLNLLKLGTPPNILFHPKASLDKAKHNILELSGLYFYSWQQNNNMVLKAYLEMSYTCKDE